MTKLNGIVPCLTIDGAKSGIDFYKKAFAAEEVSRADHEDGKRLMHAHIRINGSDVMMWDVFPELGMAVDAPRGMTIHIEVDDADRWWARAVEGRRGGIDADPGCVLGQPLRPAQGSVRPHLVDRLAAAEIR